MKGSQPILNIYIESAEVPGILSYRHFWLHNGVSSIA